MVDVFAAPTKINMSPQGFGVAQYGDDTKLNVFFYMKAVLDREASSEANTPIYKNMIYVTIHPPGERLNIVDRPAIDNDKLRWPTQWNAFTLNKIQMPEGTPVDILFPNHPAVAATLKSLGVYTIQQLAELSGNGVDSLGMGGQEYVNKAQRYLKEAGGSKAFNQLTEQVKERDIKIASLERQFQMQAETIKQLQEQLAKLGPIDRSQQNLSHVQNYDAQKARIDANHVTQDLAKQKKENVKSKTQKALEEIDNL